MNHGATQWKVRPHGSLKQVDNNILTVTGTIRMPFAFSRRMTVVRLRDGRLVVFSAIALDEDQMATLENYGVPSFLIVPNDHHRLDARMWKERYPSIQVIAPKRARHKVAEIVPVDTTDPKFGDPNVQFVEVPGTDGHEAALVVGTPYGTTLVLNDLVGNMRPQSGLLGWWLRLLGFSGNKARIPAVVRMMMIKDARALREQLLRWADIASLRRVLVSHGSPIVESPRQTLLELANSLS